MCNPRLHTFKGTLFKAQHPDSDLDIGWERIGDENHQFQFLKAEKIDPKSRIIGKLYVPNEEEGNFFETSIDLDHRYKLVDENHENEGNVFLSLYDHKGNLYGLKVTSHYEKLLHQHILKASNIEVMDEIVEKEEIPHPFLYCINHIKTKKQNVKRGATVKALCVCSNFQHIFAFKPLIEVATELIFTEDVTKVVQTLHETIKAFDYTQMKPLGTLEKFVRSSVYYDHNPAKFKKTVDFMRQQVPLEFDPNLALDDKEISLLKLIKRFKEDTMVIYNAILEEKRVLFVGFQQPVTDVCYTTISSALLVQPLSLDEIFKRRLYPYTALSQMFTDLKTPGYIAGAANLMYKNRSEVWDVLCDLDINRVYKKTNVEPQYSDMDFEFITKLLVMADNMLGQGQSEDYVEFLLRSHFREYTLHLCKMCTDEEQFRTKEAQKLQLICNAERLGNWKETNSFQFYIKQRKDEISKRIVKDVNLEIMIDRLRVGANLSEENIISFLQTFLKNARDDDQVMELLSLLPESQGGLSCIAVFLFHSSDMIRLLVVSVLQRFETFKLGQQAIGSLNTFIMLTYDRISKEMK
jgi:hypothetical protein